MLKWSKLDDLVTAKHVFGEDKWAQRHLSIKEKAESLDFPSTRTAIMTEELINLLTKSEVPGKILVASLWYLTHEEREHDLAKLVSRRRAPSACEFGSMPSPKRKKRELQTKNNKNYLGIDLEEDDLELQPTFVSQAKAEKEEVEDEYVDAKATKADNAKVPEHLWNDRIAEKLVLTWKRARRKELAEYGSILGT